MSNDRINAYAKAMLSVAQAEGDIETVTNELHAVAQAVEDVWISRATGPLLTAVLARTHASMAAGDSRVGWGPCPHLAPPTLVPRSTARYSAPRWRRLPCAATPAAIT